MTYTTGTATDNVDFLGKIREFAITVGWNEIFWDGLSLVLMGTGDAGLDEIYVSLNMYENLATDSYNLEIVGAGGYRTGASELSYSPNSCIPRSMALWSSAIDYWIVGNGRRLIIVAKISGKYMTAHLGLLRPLATNQQEPYPMYIAGTSDDITLSWSSANHSSIWNSDGFGIEARAVWLPGGRVQGTVESANTYTSYYTVGAYPWYGNNWLGTGELFSGGYVLRPALVFAKQYHYVNRFQYQTIGQIEGLFHIPGIGVSSESIITVGADSYLVIQSAALSGDNDMAALLLA